MVAGENEVFARSRFDRFELPFGRDDAARGQLLTSYASLLPLRVVSELCAPKLRKTALEPDRRSDRPDLPAVSPEQLPFCPRPLASELLTCWLGGVAVANLLSDSQLLDSLLRLCPECINDWRPPLLH